MLRLGLASVVIAIAGMLLCPLMLVAMAMAGPRETNDIVERAIPGFEAALDREEIAWPPKGGLAARMASITRVEQAMVSLESLVRTLDGQTPREIWVAVTRERLQAQIQKLRARAGHLLQAMRRDLWQVSSPPESQEEAELRAVVVALEPLESAIRNEVHTLMVKQSDARWASLLGRLAVLPELIPTWPVPDGSDAARLRIELRSRIAEQVRLVELHRMDLRRQHEEEAAAALARARELQERERAEAEKAAARTASIRAKGWPASVTEAVLARQVTLGMTREQARAAWGEPSRVNETIRMGMTTEQWVYSSSYLYFHNGILTTIQQSR